MPDSNPSSSVTAGVPVLMPIGDLKDQPLFPLGELSILVGDDPSCELQLLAAGAQGVHALLTASQQGVYIRNFAQVGHLRVNGQPVRDQPLSNGDAVQIGQFTFKYFQNDAVFQPASMPAPAGFDLGPAGAPPIAARTALIGSGANVDIRINDPNVAERHAVLFQANGAWHLRDLGSAFGTLHNGEPIRQTQINAGDQIQIGDAKLTWTNNVRPPSAPAPRPAPSASSFGGVGGFVLGGMPVNLPPASRPHDGFGKVRVTFDDHQSQSQQSESPAPAPIEPVAPQVIEEQSAPRTPVMRRFPTVPRFKSQTEAKPAASDSSASSDSSSQSQGQQPNQPGAEFAHAEYIPDVGAFDGQTIDGFGQPVLLDSQEMTPQDVFSEGVSSMMSISDAAFGGEPLSRGVHYGVEDSAENPENPVEEIEDFSENDFWDRTDEQEQHVPLPTRNKDFAPSIPAAGSAFTIVGGDVGDLPEDAVSSVVENADSTSEPAPIITEPLTGAGSPVSMTAAFQDNIFGEASAVTEVSHLSDSPAIEGESAKSGAGSPRSHTPPELDRSPLRRPAPTGQLPPDVSRLAQAPLTQAAPPRTILTLLGLMLVCMALAAAGIWFVMPARSTVEGRIDYLNLPNANTPDRAAFEADQRKRLADPSLATAAFGNLQQDQPHLAAGFLGPGTTALSQAIQNARFDSTSPNACDLVLDVNGSDGLADSQRLMELLKSLYNQESDLTSAAAAARKALSDWEPNVDSKQQELNDLDAKISQQKQLLAAAEAIVPKLNDLVGASEKWGAKYIAAEKAIVGDETQRITLDRQLANEPPTSQPSRDWQFNDIASRIDDLSSQMSSLANQGDAVTIEKTKAILDRAQAQDDQAVKDSSDVLSTRPDLAQIFQPTIDVQKKVSSMVQLLDQRREEEQGKLEEFKRLMEATSRRRQEALEEADPQIPVLREQFGKIDQKLQSAEEDDSSATEAARVSMRHEEEDIQHQLEVLETPIRQGDIESLAFRVTQLINGARSDLTADDNLINDTLQGMLAQLNSTPPPPGDMSRLERQHVVDLVVAIQQLAQAQADYAAALTNSSSDAANLDSMHDQELELEEQLYARAKELGAVPPTNQADRQKLISQRDEITKRIASERDDMEAAHGQFLTAAGASVDAALAIQQGRQAELALQNLTDSRATKVNDLTNLQQNRDQLAAVVRATPDVRPPTDGSVQIVWDNTGTKWKYTIGSELVIALIFGILTLIASDRRPADPGASARRGGGRRNKSNVPMTHAEMTP